MKNLKEIIIDGKTLAKGLQENGAMHRNYKMYTSMERALGILVSGYLYLSNGRNWNDVDDATLMNVRKVYATCFSCSTKENIALWMLYGEKHGKEGAMLNFYPSVLKEIMRVETIDLGQFNNHHQFESKYTLTKKQNDYTIFMSDVVYTDTCNNGKVVLALGDEHVYADRNILNNENVFHKNYAWSYEKECRLIVRMKEMWKFRADREELSWIRIKIPEKMVTKMKKDRLIRSPVYAGGVAIGELSELTDKVNWDL